MSLNAPASPKRLSALELTFPSLEALGYSSESEEEEYDPGIYYNPRGRRVGRSSGHGNSRSSSRHGVSPSFGRRDTSPEGGSARRGRDESLTRQFEEALYGNGRWRTENGPDSSSSNRGGGGFGGGGGKDKSTSSSRPNGKIRARHSSFAEYGDKPPPTSLAILSGLISGSARIIDRAYAEQGLPVPDIDDPGLPKSKYSKEQKELKITTEVSS